MNCELEKWFRSKKVSDQQSTPPPSRLTSTNLWKGLIKIKTEYNVNQLYLAAPSELASLPGADFKNTLLLAPGPLVHVRPA